MTTIDAIRDSLVTARREMRDEYERRLAAIEQALAAFDNGGGSDDAPTEDPDRAPKTKGVSAEKFNLVRDYARRHKRFLQVQVAKDLSTPEHPMNSGSVSVALGMMLNSNPPEVRQLGKEKSSAGYSSQVWEWIGEDDGLPTWAVRPPAEEEQQD